jgi:hypothetical protein
MTGSGLPVQIDAKLKTFKLANEIPEVCPFHATHGQILKTRPN